MAILHLSDLQESFQDAAQFAVNDCVDLLLADRDLKQFADKQPVPLFVKPQVMACMTNSVMWAWVSTGSQHNIPTPKSENICETLEQVVQNCLKNNKKITPEFTLPPWR